jgi:hypothetical protein
MPVVIHRDLVRPLVRAPGNLPGQGAFSVGSGSALGESAGLACPFPEGFAVAQEG